MHADPKVPCQMISADEKEGCRALFAAGLENAAIVLYCKAQPSWNQLGDIKQKVAGQRATYYTRHKKVTALGGKKAVKAVREASKAKVSADVLVSNTFTTAVAATLAAVHAAVQSGRGLQRCILNEAPFLFAIDGLKKVYRELAQHGDSARSRC